MSPAPTALVLYSLQILLLAGVAGLAAALARLSQPRACLAYWRGVAVACLAAPLLAGRSGQPALSVAFGTVASDSGAVAPIADSAAATLGDLLLWGWLSGLVLRAAWLMMGAFRVRQLRRRSTPADLDAEIQHLQASLAPRARFRWSADVTQPLAFGLRRPVILLPPAFNQLSAEARRAVACHELLHTARIDWISIVIEELLRTLFWFHPALWWLVDRIRLAREQVIDCLVVEHTGARRAYMGALLAFADRGGRTALSLAFLQRRHLKSRLQQLSRESTMSRARLAFTTIALAMTIASAALGAANAFPLDLAAVASQVGANTTLEIRLAETEPGAGLTEAVVPGSGRRIYLHREAIATDADIASARATGTSGSGFGVEVTLNAAAAARMKAATASHIGRPVAIVLNGSVMSAPTVRSAIGATGWFSGLTEEEARTLAASLTRAVPGQGAASDRIVLPVPITEVKPFYTPEALTAGIEGEVLLEVVVLSDGSVGDITVVRSLDSTYGLDRQAVDALRQWTWKPGTYDGKPQRVAVSVEMRFTLK